MAFVATYTAAEVGYGTNMTGNPGDDRTVTADNTSNVFSATDSLRITYDDDASKILQIEVLDSSGTVTATFRDQNNQGDPPDLSNSANGATLQSDQQTDEIGGFTQLGNFRETSTNQQFTDGSSGSFFFVAPGSSIGDGTPTTFTTGDLNGDGDVDTFVADDVPCFAAGTLIETSEGMVAVEDIVAGDLVITKDNGPQEVRYIAMRTVPAKGSTAPVVFSKGALGNTRELVVSPNHRMAVSGARVESLFGSKEMLVAAEDLIDGDTIYRRVGGEITYVHVAFDNHEIIFAEGAATESLQPLAADAAAFGGKAYDELVAIFPELSDGGKTMEPARPILRPAEAALLN